MTEFEIKGKFTADTSDFQNELSKLENNDISLATSNQTLPSNLVELSNIYKVQNDAMRDMNFQIATVNQQFENSISALQSFTQLLNNTSPFENSKLIEGNAHEENPSFSDSAQKMLVGEFEKSLPQIVYNFKQLSNSLSDVRQELPTTKSILPSIDKEKNQDLLDQTKQKTLLNLFSGGSQFVGNLIDGNVGGGVVSAFNNTATTMGNVSKVAELSGMGNMASVLSKVIPGIAIAGMVAGTAKKANDKYKESESLINNTGKAFTFDGDSDTNFYYYKRINDYNVGTGLNNDDFNQYVQTLAKQGITDVDTAGRSAREALKWAYATNGDESQYINLAGKMARYGGSTSIGNDFAYLYGAAKASGLDNTQMGEFLMGIESVMEDGIAKGFTRSAKDVADTMVMFSKLSNNDKFWQGERGAQRINQINSGLANATSMSTSAHVMTMQAFSSLYGDDENRRKTDLGSNYIENGGYLNDMLLMEKGLNANVFSSLMKTLDVRTGGDIQAKAEYLRDITGMNYTGVSKLLQLENSVLTQKELEEAIKELEKDPENQNLETRMIQALNKFDETAKESGKEVAEKVTGVLEPIATSVDAIKEFLLNEDEPPAQPMEQKTLTPQEQTKEEVFNSGEPVDPEVTEQDIIDNEKLYSVDSIGKLWRSKRGESNKAIEFLKLNYSTDINSFLNSNNMNNTDGRQSYYDAMEEVLSKSKKYGNNTYLEDLKNYTADGFITNAELTAIKDLIQQLNATIQEGLVVQENK